MTTMPGATAGIATPIAPKGVYCALLTAFDAKGEVDLPPMIDHARWLLANGCDGLSMLGTTGEGNSLSMRQRIALLEGMIKAGLPVERMVPGTGAAMIGDGVELTRHAVQMGCGGALVLPPYYYKNPSEDGIFAAFAHLIERVADSRLRLYLYHIPQFTMVPIPHAVTERLIRSFPGIVAGLKDSSGDWTNTETLLKRLPGLAVYPGSEIFLTRVARAGGAGCISGTVNFTAPLAARVRAAGDSSATEALQRKLDAVRLAVESRPLIPALKAIMVERTKYAGWAKPMPPHLPLPEETRAALFRDLDAILPRAAGGGWDLRP